MGLQDQPDCAGFKSSIRHFNPISNIFGISTKFSKKKADPVIWSTQIGDILLMRCTALQCGETRSLETPANGHLNAVMLLHIGMHDNWRTK